MACNDDDNDDDGDDDDDDDDDDYDDYDDDDDDDDGACGGGGGGGDDDVIWYMYWGYITKNMIWAQQNKERQVFMLTWRHQDLVINNYDNHMCAL